MSLHVGCLAPTHLHLHPSLHTEERVSSICMRFAPVTLHIIRSPLPQIPPQYVTIYSQRGHGRSRGFSYRSSSAPVAMMNSFPTKPHTQTHTHLGQHVYVGWLMRKPKENKMTKVEPYLKKKKEKLQSMKCKVAVISALNCRKAALIQPYLLAYRDPEKPECQIASWAVWDREGRDGRQWGGFAVNSAENIRSDRTSRPAQEQIREDFPNLTWNQKDLQPNTRGNNMALRLFLSIRE